MGSFVISKRDDGAFKFAYAARRGKTILTGIACRDKADCEKIVVALMEDVHQFAVTRIKQSSGKHFFRVSKEGLVLANSRKFTTELLMQKGLNDFLTSVSSAEILDFSANRMVVWADAEVGILPE